MKKLFLFLTLPLFVLDQLTKLWIVKSFPDPTIPGIASRTIEVISGFFNIVRVHNTGMAFGMLNGTKYANVLFCLIGIVAITFVIVLWKKGAFPDKISKVAAALLVSGIMGNFTDRIIPGRGYVVDFLDFQPPFYEIIDASGHFPSFNVADSCICIAAGLLIVSAFRSPKGESKKKSRS